MRLGSVLLQVERISWRTSGQFTGVDCAGLLFGKSDEEVHRFLNELAGEPGMAIRHRAKGPPATHHDAPESVDTLKRVRYIQTT